MRHERVPGGKLFVIELGDSAQRSFFQIPVIGVFVERNAGVFFRSFHLFNVFVPIALPKRAVMKEVIAQPRISHRSLRR